MSTHTHHDVSRDKGPAFVGLIAGVVLLGAFMYGMVKWTNSRYAGHAEGAAPPAAGAPQH
jgi:hypothetical protein